ncbi:GNAT family N-acetyltransferase [Mucilaginibacter celer]|uniref:GNAT family N-acetyltransferase n=1 Tax=Mucilaginibacter celer TaxID=2305508 RepID=A0A494W7D0_9SPHI|nr:GNAT family N-acetyltransferase [Mucilaginibacter celer]AYL99445.1 GNAT family N-acetyltransferase [Mucilaginibacter celer]
MDHVLDNPAWNALETGNKAFAGGNDIARYFPKEVSPFVALNKTSAENFDLLFNTIPFESYFIFIAPHDIEIPAPWETLAYLKCLQMVLDDNAAADVDDADLVPLTDQHIPQMLELTKLTNPGPFAERTIDFGHYRGIFDGDKLVAMAGQRLNPKPYAEISAVCTHPDYLGRGYAGKLLLNQARRIRQAGEIPFLHVKAENERAIRVYEKLGFVTRKEMSFYVLRKGAL